MAVRHDQLSRKAQIATETEVRRWIGLRVSVVSNRYTTSLYAEIERRHGLLRDEAAVLVCLAIVGGTTAQVIARYTARPKNSISRAVRKLEADGLIRREGDLRDARASTLRFTPSGRALFNQLRGYFEARDALFTNALDQDEQEQFDRLLTKIMDSSSNWA
jgi:DNA-binding MarR family transcriptional regulator